MKLEKIINKLIYWLHQRGFIDTNNISDGCHTFEELYEHRAKLFSVICNTNKEIAWKSKLHDDGTMLDGYFIVGLETEQGQATYHYGLCYWDLFEIMELEKAPKYDGHTSREAIGRIKMLGKSKL